MTGLSENDPCPECGAYLTWCDCHSPEDGHLICSASGEDAGQCDLRPVTVRLVVTLEAVGGTSVDDACSELTDALADEWFGMIRTVVSVTPAPEPEPTNEETL